MILLAFIVCVLGAVTASPIEGPGTVIVSGNDVPLGLTVPYHIHLHLVTPTAIHVGSAVYIGTKYAITVAQHLKLDDLIEVRCGFGNRDRRELTWLVAVKFFPHQQYNPKTLLNNIGYLVLPSEPDVSKIWMANDASFHGPGTIGMIYGFGFTTNEGNFAQILQQSQQTIQTDADCRATYPHLSGMLETTFCAIGTGTIGNVSSMCGGDQGGPFVVADTLVGISSFWRRNNCFDGESSGFVRIAPYRQWIYWNTGH